MRNYLTWRSGLFMLSMSALLVALLPGGIRHSSLRAQLQPKEQLRAAISRLPLRFEAAPGESRFVARSLPTQGFRLSLTGQEAVMQFGKEEAQALRLKFVNGNSRPVMSGVDELPGRSHYLIGSDPRAWRTEVAHFARVRYEEIYPGIDLVWYGNGQELEYDFVLAPGADPRQIRLAFTGAEQLRIDDHGDLILSTTGGELRQRQPIVYQETISGRQQIAGRYVQTGEDEIGFELAAYDCAQPLVIDPVLAYSSYLGSGGDEAGFAIAVDPTGNIYVAGFTDSSSFPGVNGAQKNFGGFLDGFIAKLNPGGTTLVYATYLGGTQQDACVSLAVDADGSVLVTGITDSVNFPTVSALQPRPGGGDFDAFVAKLNPAGSAFAWSTYLGGTGDDQGYAIALDSAGNACVTGVTDSVNFLKVQARQPDFGGVTDAFVTKFNATGAALLYSSYLGGAGVEFGTGVAVDANNNIYVTGVTDSLNFPTVQPLQTNFGGGAADVFVTKLNSDFAAYGYSTYLGGSADDRIALPGNAIAVDQNGSVYLTGFTRSANFPVANALQPAFAGGSSDGPSDAFVTKLNPAGSALVYSTYLGGSDQENVGDGDFLNHDIAVDIAGNAYVTGSTRSSDFPLANAAQQNLGGFADAFVAKLNATGSTLVYSTYLGGGSFDAGLSIAVDQTGNAFVSGMTTSGNFPTVNALQPNYQGIEADAFIVRLNADAVTVSAASFSGAAITSKAIVAAFGPALATTTEAATTLPLPTTLAGTMVRIRDSAGTERAAPLFFVSPQQINYQIPDGTATGPASVIVTSSSGRVSSAVIRVAATAPSIFTTNQSGSGQAAALDAFTFTPAPFNARRPSGEANVIAIFGTGLGPDATDVDGNVSASVQATLDGNPVSVLYAGRAPGFTGLNQINLLLPTGISSGDHTLIVSRNNVASNPVVITIR
jgi:uncharacterized protein (TIGR03437 family)